MIQEEIILSSRAEWRAWLAQNGASSSKIYVVYHKKDSGVPSILYREAVEEALCFGWIDSTVKRIDDKRYKQLFTPRKATSTWSKLNKNLVAMLEEQGLMTDAGRKCIDVAQQNGSWDLLTDSDNHVIPPDFQAQLTPELEKIFHSLTPSQKSMHLRHIGLKKGSVARQKVILHVCEHLRLKKQNPAKM
ncbi:MAG: YdeI/OmpD-associated family protein [Brevinema sp.]